MLRKIISYFTGLEIRNIQELNWLIEERERIKRLNNGKNGPRVPEHQQFRETTWYICKTSLHKRMTANELLANFGTWNQKNMQFNRLIEILRAGKRAIEALKDKMSSQLYKEKVNLIECSIQLIEDFSKDVYLRKYFDKWESKNPPEQSISALEYVRNGVATQIKKMFEGDNASASFDQEVTERILDEYIGGASVPESQPEIYDFFKEIVSIIKEMDSEFDPSKPLTDRLDHRQVIHMWYKIIAKIEHLMNSKYCPYAKLQLQHVYMFTRTMFSMVTQISSSFQLERNDSKIYQQLSKFTGK